MAKIVATHPGMVPPPLLPTLSRAEFEALTAHQQSEAFAKHAAKTMTLNIGFACPKHGPQPIQFMCAHSVESTQDPVHPVGMVATPHGYYLCARCWKRMDDRKFRFYQEMKVGCKTCVLEFVAKLLLRDPSLVMDLTKKLR